ncbi:MAG: TIM barrel protein [Novosphingobium sp.]
MAEKKADEVKVSDMNQISLDFLSGLGMAPVEFVELAATIGCGSITLGIQPLGSIGRYPTWSFRGAPALVRETRKALVERGITLAAGEGWFVVPRHDFGDTGGDLDIMAELGAASISTCGLDPDLARSFDQIAVLTEMAAARGMGTNIEFVATMPIGSLETALEAVAHVGRPESGLVIDAMHLFRSGASAADVAAVGPGLIRHVQVCDAPMTGTGDYGYEATFERLPPGHGEFPLAELLAAVPRGVTLGLEIPMRARAEAGDDPVERLRPCVEATRKLMA